MWYASSPEGTSSLPSSRSSRAESATQPQNLCELPLTVRVDGAVQPSHTTFLRKCAYAVMLDTKVTAPDLHVHLNSDYTGYADRTTRSSHYSDARGPTPGHTDWSSTVHPPGAIDVRWSPSDCLYDYLQRLLDLFEQLGHPAQVDVDDEVLRPFEALAQGLSVAAGLPRRVRLRSDLAAILGSWPIFGARDNRRRKP